MHGRVSGERRHLRWGLGGSVQACGSRRQQVLASAALLLLISAAAFMHGGAGEGGKRGDEEYNRINAYFSSFKPSSGAELQASEARETAEPATTTDGTYFSAPVQMDGKVRAAGGGTPSQSDGYRSAVLRPPFESSHGSNLLLLPSGELLLSWFSGSDEGGDGVAIVVARLPPRQWEWEEAVVASRERMRSAQNPVLYWDAEKEEVVLLHTSQQAYEGQATSEVRRVTSRDKGRTWGEASPLFEEAGAFLRNQVMRSGDGSELLLPMYYTPRGFFHHASQYSSVRRSRDGGATWEETVMEGTRGRCVQPTLVRIDSARLQAFFRSRAADRIYLSESSDDGRSWSRPKPLQLPNNNSGIQALR